MTYFELEPKDISELSDKDLRELVARLCEAELVSKGISPSCVLWGGAQEAADGGLDVRVRDAAPLSGSSFLRREHTGFQVKKHSMGKAACKDEMLDNGILKPVIADLLAKKGAYIIVSGKDDCSDKMLSERVLGMHSAINGLANSNDILLDFYGRDRLSVCLRQFPSVSLWVRSRLGKPLSGWKSYGRWAATPNDQDDKFLFDDHPCVIDVNTAPKAPISIADGLICVREKLRKLGAVVRMTGLSGVGKTRFAQALFEEDIIENALPASNVIYADLGDDLTPTASEFISYLVTNDFSSYVVLDNCPSDVHRKLQKQLSSQQTKLSLLTIEYDISDDRPEQTEVIHIEPSSEKTVSKLIQKRFTSLGQVNAKKIADFAGGNARLAIALASQVGANETLTNFSDEDLFQRLFHQRKGVSDSLLENAEILSLVYSFNISQAEFNDELNILSKVGGVERNSLYRSQAELLRRQLSQKRGNWRAVLPHALANRLARRALQNISFEQINTEFFKKENLRLFKSCAHRLGYLHDFEPAQQLALTWTQEGFPFHNIATCDSELLIALSYMAPVLPNVVLSAIENASTRNQDFCSRNNKNFYFFVQLLRKIAYDDQYFDRATELILRFAITEKDGENHNSIVDVLSSLFSLYLSGTQATPIRRQAFVNRILASGGKRQLEIAKRIFRCAFETSHWSYHGGFDFGARRRDFGWQPEKDEEKLNWYQGFIGLLTPLLDLDSGLHSQWAKSILADSFTHLWTYTDCLEILESIVRQYAEGGEWSEMWMAIKKTIYFNGKDFSPEIFTRLDELERFSTPSNPYSEIEIYALNSTWDLEYLEIEADDDTAKLEKLEQKIVKLGELAAIEPNYLEKLAPRLWEKRIDSLWAFGKGLALGSSDQVLTFNTLVSLMKQQKLTAVDPILFRGFIFGVYVSNPNLAQQIQESVLDIPELKQHFVYLLASTPITPWGIDKLIELVQAEELEAWRFQQIGYGRAHESITDDHLVDFLSALNNLNNGVFATIEILNMRFFIEKGSTYIPSDSLRAVGRQSLVKMLSMQADEIKARITYGVDRVIRICFSEHLSENEVHDIVDLLCDGIRAYRLEGIAIEKISDHLIKTFPECVLDRLFKNEGNNDFLFYRLFKPNLTRKGSSLNLASIDRIIKWCDGNQERIQKVAEVVSAYTNSGDNSINDYYDDLTGNPKNLKLSNHIIALLDAAEDKAAIVDIIFDSSVPHSWFGSRASIIEIRSKALSELLNYNSPEVQKTAQRRLAHLDEQIKRNKEIEIEEYMREEQRFE